MVINTLAEILQISSAEKLREIKIQLDCQLEEALHSLEEELSKSMTTSEPQAILSHMGYIESQRDRVTKFLLLVDNLLEHAKSDNFILEGKATEFKRDQHRRSLTTGLTGWSTRLDHLIRSIDSRVNVMKKILGFEESASNNSGFRRAA